MLASLLRPKPRRQQADEPQFPGPFTPSDHNNSPWFRAAANRGGRRVRGFSNSAGYGAPELQDVDEEDIDEDEDGVWVHEDDEEDDERHLESTPLLPIFSASHLGMSPAPLVLHYYCTSVPQSSYA